MELNDVRRLAVAPENACLCHNTYFSLLCVGM